MTGANPISKVFLRLKALSSLFGQPAEHHHADTQAVVHQHG
jgi:hypothetical protein